MSDKNFRELQVSSSQLVVIFLAILILGLIVFLLGVSVGKKQTEIVLQAVGGAPAVKESAAIIKPNVPLPADKEAETEAKPAVTESTRPPTGVAQQKQAGQPEIKPEVKTEAKPTSQSNEQMKAQPLKEKIKETAVKTKAVPEKPVVKAQPVKAKKQTIYYVQVGAFNTKEQAQSWADRFKQDGYPTIVVDPNPEDKRPYYRVRLGGYLTKEEAEDVKSKLKPPSRKSGDYLIVRIEN